MAAVERGFALARRGRRRCFSQTPAVNITTAERTRRLVKLAGSIRSGARANRQRSEFAAKQSIAALVSTTARVACRAEFAVMSTR